MSSKILYGKPIAYRIEREIAEYLPKVGGGKNPVLGVVRVGGNPDAEYYKRGIEKVSKKAGVGFKVFSFTEDISEDDFIGELEKLNHSKDIDGYIVLLPLPEHINPDAVLEHIAPDMDIEGVTPYNLGKILMGEPVIIPPTPFAVIEMLKGYNIEIAGRNVVIIGRSKEVGMPLANLLLSKKDYGNATVTVCHSKTGDLKNITRRADILIVSIGVPLFVKEDYVNKKAVVIDVGINYYNGRLVGDVDFDRVKDRVSAITPVPGGVGVITSHLIVRNLLRLYDRKIQ